MPKLNDHGLGGSGKSLGIPVYPFKNIEGVVEDNTKALDRFYGDPITEAPIEIYGGASCQVDDEIYFFGSKTSNSVVYKYNVKHKNWTKLTNSPNSEAKNWAEAIGTDIWYGCTTTIYKYNTLTNTHTEIISPRDFTGTKSTTDGKDIYLIGGSGTGNYNLTQKYNVSTNKLTNLANSPDSNGHCCEYGGDGYIYLFGGSSNVTRASRYSIANNSYETLTSIPFQFVNGITVRHNNYILLISSLMRGNGVNYTNTMYAFDVTSLTYTKLTDIITSRFYGHGANVDGTLYIMGGGEFETSYNTGDSLTVLKGVSANFSVQRLYKGVKVHTDGDIVLGTLNDIGEIPIFENTTTINNTNGVARIATDGEYAIIDGNYATIGG